MTTPTRPETDEVEFTPEQMGRFKNIHETLSGLGNPFAGHEHGEGCGEGCGHDHDAPAHDYVALLQLTAEDAPSLLNIAWDWLDQEFPPDFPVWIFAPVHAWRALAQLKAVDTAEELLGLYEALMEDDDEAGAEIPAQVAAMGPQAWPVLMGMLDHMGPDLNLLEACYRAVDGDGERRAQFVALCAEFLSEHVNNEPDSNAALAILLGELDSEKAHSLGIEQAFAADTVNEAICGAWGAFRETYAIPATGLAKDERRVRWWRDALGESLYERQLVRQRQHLNARDKAKEEKAKVAAPPAKKYKKRK